MEPEERERLQQRISELEAANERLREEYGRAASQHAHVAGLLAAFHRLHSTLVREAVLDALDDILSGLLACEEAAAYELVGDPPQLALLAAFGVATESVPPLPDAVLPAMRAGRLFVAASYGAEAGLRPRACLPLRVDGRVVGAIALFRLADHKLGLTNADWEVLDVISTHAGTALMATRDLATDAGRR
jgi:hypothetical protein